MGRRKRQIEDDDSYMDFDADDDYVSSISRGEFLDSFGDDEEESDWDLLDDDDEGGSRMDSDWMSYGDDSFN